MRAAFVTFGCRLNQAEARDMEARFVAAGNVAVPLEGSPDVIYVRGCSVTAKAARDTAKAISRLRRDHPAAAVVPLGCAVDAAADPDFGTPPFDPSLYRHARAYLKVQDGCNAACAYCIVPRFRGAARSVPPEEVLFKARGFAGAGFGEIVVSGCNLAQYSHAGAKNFPALLSMLADALPEVRFRVGSFEPGVCDDDLLTAFVSHGNICRFLHLSVQSAAEDVLKRMKRSYSAARLDGICRMWRQAFPERFMLGCDVISGFPGETEGDFAATRGFLGRWNFALVHSFPYSERPGTPAAEMPGTVHEEVRADRAAMLSADAAARHLAFARSFEGRTVDVAVEQTGEESAGWTGEYLRAVLHGCFPRRAVVAARVAGVGCDGTLRASAI